MSFMSPETDDDPRPVRRCVCADVTFAKMREAYVVSVEDAGQRFGAGGKCKRCVPYIRRMIETGETEFAVLGG